MSAKRSDRLQRLLRSRWAVVHLTCAFLTFILVVVLWLLGWVQLALLVGLLGLMAIATGTSLAAQARWRRDRETALALRKDLLRTERLVSRAEWRILRALEDLRAAQTKDHANLVKALKNASTAKQIRDIQDDLELLVASAKQASSDLEPFPLAFEHESERLLIALLNGRGEQA